MERTDLKTGETITTVPTFSTKAEVVLESTDLNDFYERAKQKILELLSTFQQLGSSWRFVSVRKMDINIIEYKPLKDNSYIPLPEKLAAKKATINMKNEDNECFKCSVYPLRRSKNINSKYQIDLLLISNDESNHYCLIKDLSRVLSSQISEHNGKNHFCRNCLQAFSTEESLSKHKLYCDTHDSVRIELPKPNTMIDIEKTIEKTIGHSILATFTADSEDDDVAQIFVDNLEADIKKIYDKYLKFPKKMIFTSKEKENFDNAEKCHICEEDLKEDKKLSGDGKSEGGKINCIPNNEEKYISFSKEIKVNEYTNKKEKVFTPMNGLILLTNFLKHNYHQNESFYSRLNDKDISDKEYSHAQTVWNEFHCKTFKDYHNLYNVSDVLLLADVFENFRDLCMKKYKLDPSWYYTSPGLAWDAALKITKVKLELLSDYDVILMLKQGIRGGISTISNRQGISNNKYLETFDESKESTYIQYLDANNLYGWAMSKPIPTHGFEWMNEEELKNWKSISRILEVDLDYPENLHDLHNDYPLAPERLNK
ncbi:uncharacterized protein LOC136093437 [Hydra vulgaris]|uniref:uncharacterized protein LOC136093437 n=1 Tax=Hydra vulgaris TaxID=6087 RepID=UPI0032EA1B39